MEAQRPSNGCSSTGTTGQNPHSTSQVNAVIKKGTQAQGAMQPLCMNINLPTGILNGAFHEGNNKFEPLRVISAIVPIWRQNANGLAFSQAFKFCIFLNSKKILATPMGPIIMSLEGGHCYEEDCNSRLLHEIQNNYGFEEEPKQIIIREQLLEGPPPGFEGIPKYGNQVRRRQRLQAENSGPYATPTQKAQKVLGYSNDYDTMDPRKKKAKSAKQPEMEYLNSYDPLSENHGQAWHPTESSSARKNKRSCSGRRQAKWAAAGHELEGTR